MAPNFRISVLQNGQAVHLNLSGEFDGSAACQLIHALKAHSGEGARVFIDTETLSSIHPFGLGVFQKDCAINNLFERATFTGQYGTVFVPENRRIRRADRNRRWHAEHSGSD